MSTTNPSSRLLTLSIFLLLGLGACNVQNTAPNGQGNPTASHGAPAPSEGGTGAPPAGSPPPATHDCMSDIDREMLDQINQARSASRQCGTQQFPAAPALRWSCTLAEVALDHSRDMGDHNFFSHTGSDGLSPSQRVTNGGYLWRATGENIAAGPDTVSEVMAGWLSSPGHCANIMSDNYTEVGAARYRNDGSDYRIYWTQEFATPR